MTQGRQSAIDAQRQASRPIADAIIGEDNSLIGGLKREDLELLLS